MTAPLLYAVVPVKRLINAKTRLASMLTRDETTTLAATMCSDILRVLSGSDALAATLVVTADIAVKALAEGAGAQVLHDREDAGMRAAVQQAAAHLADIDAAGMLVVPADVPLITVEDVRQLAASLGSAPAVTLVRAARDGGTNALACSPPLAIPFCFGANSFEMHVSAAEAAGLRPTVITLCSIAHDIDTPHDIERFMGSPSPTRTFAYLQALGIRERALSRQIVSL